MISTYVQNAFSQKVSIDTELSNWLEKNNFQDTTWKNDTSPSMGLNHNFEDREIRVFIEFDNSEMRELPNCSKYFVVYYDNCDVVESLTLQTDDYKEVINRVKEILKSNKPFIRGE